LLIEKHEILTGLVKVQTACKNIIQII